MSSESQAAHRSSIAAPPHTSSDGASSYDDYTRPNAPRELMAGGRPMAHHYQGQEYWDESQSQPPPAIPPPPPPSSNSKSGNTTIQFLSMGSGGSTGSTGGSSGGGGGGERGPSSSSWPYANRPYDHTGVAARRFYNPQAEAYHLSHQQHDVYPEYPFNRSGRSGIPDAQQSSSSSPHRRSIVPPPPPPSNTPSSRPTTTPGNPEDHSHMGSGEMEGPYNGSGGGPHRVVRHRHPAFPPHVREDFAYHASRNRLNHHMPPYHQHPHHPGPPYYDSMEMDPATYDESNGFFYSNGYNDQQHHPPPPPNYGMSTAMDTDPPNRNVRPGRGGGRRNHPKIYVSPSPPSDQEEVISPSMSNATATTAASSSNASFCSREQPQQQRSNNNGTTRAMSDRKQMQSQAWYDRFRELTKYKENHGNCMVPQKYEPNPSLGIWVNKQRMEYKLLQDGEKSSMTNERLSALQSIGFVWAKRKGQATWDAKYKQLQEYKATNGDCLIPTKYAQDPALGRWVSTQREQYRLWKAGDERSKMTVEKVRLLEEAGFVWRLQF